MQIDQNEQQYFVESSKPLSKETKVTISSLTRLLKKEIVLQDIPPIALILQSTLY